MGASPYPVNGFGAGALHDAADNENNTAGLLMLLVGASADVNLGMTPRTRGRRWILRFTRWAVEHGAQAGLLKELAVLSGQTALMIAARAGKAAEVRALLDMAANHT